MERCGAVKKLLSVLIASIIAVTMLLTTLKTMAAIDFSGTTGWNPILPANSQFDPVGDQQTGLTSSDIVGDGTYRSFYVSYDSVTNSIGLRIRINAQDGTASAYSFKNFVFAGLDCNQDGKIDLFVGLYNPTGNNGKIGIFEADPAKANDGPSTTGILNPYFQYTPAANSNYSLIQATDGSNFSSNPDFFISFRIPLNDINSSLTLAGKTYSITADSVLRYIVGTSSQANSFNQDLNGINGMAATGTWEQLGIFSNDLTPTGDTYPTASDVNTSTPVNTPITDNLGATDVDNDPLTYAVKTGTGPANGTASVDSSGNWTYTPNTDFIGQDSFVVTVDDGRGGVIDVTVTVNVLSPSNEAPVADPQTIITKQNAAVSGTLTATDADGNALTYSIVTQSTKGSVSLDGSTGDFTYLPDTGQYGADSFTFQATDGALNSNTATVSVTIHPYPVVSGPSNQTVDIGAAADFSVTADSLDGYDLIYQWQVSTDNWTSWGDIPSSDSPTYTTGSAQSSDSGIQYRCVITNKVTGLFTVSSPATLTVNPEAAVPTVSIAPVTTTTYPGTDVTLTATASSTDGGSITYQWQKSTDDGSSWSDVTGEIGQSMTASSLALSDDGVLYRCVATNQIHSTSAQAVSNSSVIRVITLAETIKKLLENLPDPASATDEEIDAAQQEILDVKELYDLLDETGRGDVGDPPAQKLDELIKRLDAGLLIYPDDPVTGISGGGIGPSVQLPELSDPNVGKVRIDLVVDPITDPAAQPETSGAVNDLKTQKKKVVSVFDLSLFKSVYDPEGSLVSTGDVPNTDIVSPIKIYIPMPSGLTSSELTLLMLDDSGNPIPLAVIPVYRNNQLYLEMQFDTFPQTVLLAQNIPENPATGLPPSLYITPLLFLVFFVIVGALI